MCPGVVTRRRESDDAGRELDVTRDYLDALDEGLDAPANVRQIRAGLRESECVSMNDVARAGKEHDALEIRVPAEMINVKVRQEDDVDLVRSDAQVVERAGQATFVLGGPVPETRRPDTGVHEDRDPLRADEEAVAREAPAVTGEELRIELAVQLPLFSRHLGIDLGVVGEQSDRVGHRQELDRADYHRTRGGAGSPCASSQPTTGFLSTPMRSISASITSPGLR